MNRDEKRCFSFETTIQSYIDSSDRCKKSILHELKSEPFKKVIREIISLLILRNPPIEICYKQEGDIKKQLKMEAAARLDHIKCSFGEDFIRLIAAHMIYVYTVHNISFENVFSAMAHMLDRSIELP